MKLEKILNDARLKGTRRKATLLIQREIKKRCPALIVCGIILFICMCCGIYCWFIGTAALLDSDESIPDTVLLANMIDRWAHNVAEWNVGGLPTWAAWLIVVYIATVVISSIGVLFGEAVVSFCAAKTCKKWKTKDLTECCGKAYDLLRYGWDFDCGDYPAAVVLGGVINAVFCAGLVISAVIFDLKTDGAIGVSTLVGLVVATIILWFALWLVSGLPCAILDWKCNRLDVGTSEREKFKEFWAEIDPEKKAEFEEAARREAAEREEYRKNEEYQPHYYQPLLDTSSNTSSSSSIDHDALDAVQDAMNDLYGPGWGSDI